MASRECVNYLRKALVNILKDPPPNIIARPNPKNILEWHYVIFGPKDSIYAGGVYHGKLKFPADYPYKPPSIYMITPNGRFQQNTRLCLSMSDFHPETWNPMWTVSSILTGLLSFMLEDTATTGSMNSSRAEKRSYAKLSMEYNLNNPVFKKMFPELESADSIEAQRPSNIRTTTTTTTTISNRPTDSERSTETNREKDPENNSNVVNKANEDSKADNNATAVLMVVVLLVIFIAILNHWLGEDSAKEL
eukprot:TRINITY_DN1784_c0_g1_i2.p1 TRINITY_DN1784_c0_g1~~TRINITY_DN1784_c0_g1_i2.p1  ORF type:complete len:249 (+),score=31.90 TRINITY_DN1784_c0_g1_i2:34-780(+)